MGDRIVRASILDSEAVNQLTWAAEVFYRRLMSVADDYGRFDARLAILRSQLYPIKINQVSEADLAKWMDECSTAGLVSFYEVDGKPYLEILKFQQRLRAMKSKYPPPLTSAGIRGQPLSNAVEEKRREFEVEVEEKGITHAHEKKLYDLDYFRKMGYGDSFKSFDQEILQSLNQFLCYRSRNPTHGPIRSPDQLESILKTLLMRKISAPDFEQMVLNTMEKGAKNIIYEKPKNKNGNEHNQNESSSKIGRIDIETAKDFLNRRAD